MQAVIRFLFTIFTTLSVLFSNLLSPATVYPESDGFDFLFLEYPEEAENFGIRNVVFRNISYTSYMKPKIAGTDSNTNTVQVELDGITVCGKKQSSPETLFTVGKYCEVTSS